MDKQTTLLLIVLFTLTIPLSLGLALWLVARLRRSSDRPLSRDAMGVTVVPVRGLKRSYRFFGYAQNSLNPRVEIAADGLRFKLFRPDHWPFAEIAQVHAFALPFVTRLEIRSRSSGRLYVDLADQTRAGDFLRALPATLPYTPRATALRDAG